MCIQGLGHEDVRIIAMRWAQMQESRKVHLICVETCWRVLALVYVCVRACSLRDPGIVGVVVVVIGVLTTPETVCTAPSRWERSTERR